VAETEIRLELGRANPRQLEFFAARESFVCYGGAKGGGKTWAVRVKAILGALVGYPGIRILIMRAHYPELEMNHIRPMRAMLPKELAVYNGTKHLLEFRNGSVIKFGHWSGDESENEYNGQEYDWIFIDEATQFSERSFNFLCGCLRGTTPIPRRMYLTCNPGGIGHFWVKWLFIDRRFRTDGGEQTERLEDYRFIFATVDDNTELLRSSPNYKNVLAKMPNAAAYRYGDWDAIGGNYFSELSTALHTAKPFRLPENWYRYRSIDYGLDMFVCLWFAADSDGRLWCYRELEQKELIAGEAARTALEHTPPGESILCTFAPPDIWSRQKDSGRTMAEIFALNGLPLRKCGSSRVQGHLMLKECLCPIPLRDPEVIALFPDGQAPDRLPGLMFFSNVTKVFEDMKSIQADERDPNDCAKQPHELTHTVDAARYMAISRWLAADEHKQERELLRQSFEEEELESYVDYGVFHT